MSASIILSKVPTADLEVVDAFEPPVRADGAVEHEGSLSPHPAPSSIAGRMAATR
jgi:hypothetical protein